MFWRKWAIGVVGWEDVRQLIFVAVVVCDWSCGCVGGWVGGGLWLHRLHIWEGGTELSVCRKVWGVRVTMMHCCMRAGYLTTVVTQMLNTEDRNWLLQPLHHPSPTKDAWCQSWPLRVICFSLSSWSWTRKNKVVRRGGGFTKRMSEQVGRWGSKGVQGKEENKKFNLVFTTSKRKEQDPNSFFDVMYSASILLN